MGTYEDLKNAIADVIYTNGNNEITGIILQQILQRIVTTIGMNATFAGIATPETDPGEIDQNVIYLAYEPGIYDNFNGQEIKSGVGIFSNKNGIWEYMDSGLLTDLSISVIYAELVTLRNNGKLKPGMLYRITDYITTTTQSDTQSAGHPFDVIVLALSESELLEQAWAVQSARDTDRYFANSKLSAWKIWYCLDNDTSRFAWADATNGKGVIYRMIDEHNNDCPYDFKNIIILLSGLPLYTFGRGKSLNCVDHSLTNYCYDNRIEPHYDIAKMLIPLNYFVVSVSSQFIAYNVLETGSRNNRFEGETIRNRLGLACLGNIFSGASANNILGNGCSNNTFGNNFGGNIVEKNCQSLYLGGQHIQQNVFKTGNTRISISFNYVRFCEFDLGAFRLGCTLECAETASSNVQVQNYHFTKGLPRQTITVERNRSYETTVAVDSSGNVKQFCVADLAQ